MNSNRKLILYIAMSIDGYIAKPNDDLAFLSIVEKDGEDYGYNDFVSSVDTVIIGRKTYDWVSKQFEFPHADKETYVITRTAKPSNGNISFYTGDIADLVSSLKRKNGNTIFCDGGAEIVNMLLQKMLFDELIISLIPVLVGKGTKLFSDGRPEQNLMLINSKTFDTGLTQLHYKVISK